ncbi:MAG: hypothetical protein R2873_07815 [Caldilineaceae bacterium]
MGNQTYTLTCSRPGSIVIESASACSVSTSPSACSGAGILLTMVSAVQQAPGVRRGGCDARPP